jgi:hypothetical protein
MAMKRILVAVATILSAQLAYAQEAPLADHHQHLFSPALAALISPAPPATALDADRSRRPDRAPRCRGYQRACGALNGLHLGAGEPGQSTVPPKSCARTTTGPASRWPKYPDRLIGFCGINPAEGFTRSTSWRAAQRDPNLRNGPQDALRQFGVDYHNAQHLEQLRRVFRAANGYRMPNCRPHARIVSA